MIHSEMHCVSLLLEVLLGAIICCASWGEDGSVGNGGLPSPRQPRAKCKRQVLCRKLLARLCLVREELQNELLNQAFGQGQGAKAAQELEENMRLLNQLLPTYVAAFVKDLISVGSSERR